MKTALVLGFCLALSSLPSVAQSPTSASPSPGPEFEAVSVRLAIPYTEAEVRAGLGNNPWNAFPSNRFTAHRLTLKLLIELIYGVEPDNIRGEPGWLDSQHYDIEAKVEGDSQLTLLQMKPLLQHLLEERFHLVTHEGSKMVSGYALVIGKHKPSLQLHKAGGAAHAYYLREGLDANDMSMPSFASLIAHPAGGPVIDRTNLQGTYDFKLSYDAMADPKSNLPSVFTAVQEQLGLKLVPEKLPVHTLIIDRVERIPTEN
ncbi:MAG: TIGR03435 family protein [Acidobacteriota bacterium]|nr:TIGR03435 family protein [Acidobacteriota bacterium]